MANKIVLSGYYGFDNIGDEAVLYSIVSLLKKEVPGIEITVLSNNPEATSKTYQVASINRWDIKAVAKAIKASDMLISGGGSLLQDVTSSKTIPYYLGVVKIAQFYKKKVVFYSQGIGPVNKGFSRWLVKKVVNKVDGIFVREPASKALLEEIGIKKTIGVAIDPVIGINDGDESLKDIEFVGPHAVGIYIRPWQDEKHDENLLESMQEGLKTLLESGYKLYLIPMHYDQDKAIAEKLANKLIGISKDYAQQVVVVDKKLSIEQVLKYTSSFEFIVGMRLHSLIMAAGAKVPMLGLSYDPKVTAFMKEIEVPYCIDSDKITSEQFTNRLKELIVNREEQKKHLEKMYEQKRQKVYLPVEHIKKVLL